MQTYRVKLSWRDYVGHGIQRGKGNKGQVHDTNKAHSSHPGLNTNQPCQTSIPSTCFPNHLKQQNLGCPLASEYNQYIGKGTTGISTCHHPKVECEYSHRIKSMQHWSLQDFWVWQQYDHYFQATGFSGEACNRRHSVHCPQFHNGL